MPLWIYYGKVRPMKVIVIGSGIVGASAAYHLVKQNADVLIIDEEHTGHATAAGAGIICPWDSDERNDPLYHLADKGAHFYPSLIDQLSAESEIDISYKKVGALLTSSDGHLLDKAHHQLK